MVTARQAAAAPSDPVGIDVDAVLAAEQQVEATDAAYPFVTSYDVTQLDPYTQDNAISMLYVLLNQQNILVANPESPYLPNLPYAFSAPLANPQTITGDPNMDNRYDFLPVSSNETYTLTVTPEPGTEDLSFSPIANYSASNEQGTTLPGALDLENATANANGTYTIVLSPTDPSGVPVDNWVNTSGADEVFIRNTVGNWGLEPDQLSLTSDPSVAESPFAVPLLSNAEIASMLSTIAADMPANNASDFGLQTVGGKLPDNAFTPIENISSVGGVGGGLTGQLVDFGHFSLEPGQALIVQVPNIDAPYSSLSLDDIWTENDPYATAEASLNNSQVFSDPDGSTYYVISDTNPGVANWIDTSGASDGQVLMRWDCGFNGVSGLMR